MYAVKSFVNQPVDSVTYVVSDKITHRALIIDPGTENDLRITDYLQEAGLIPEHILLTHEHFDHILGVNFLREYYSGIKLAASSNTSERLPEVKKNLSVFHNQTYLVVDEADIILDEGSYIFSGLPVEVCHTPGHTDSSLTFIIGTSLFSGDFMLPSVRAVTNLPTGSRTAYQESLRKIKGRFSGYTLYPGHGTCYQIE